MTNVLTFKEISELVDHIPAREWEHTFSGDFEHLEFSMADSDWCLLLQGNNCGRRTGTAPLVLRSVSVEISYVNAPPLAEYMGTKKVRELFYSTRERVMKYNDNQSELTIEKQLQVFGVSKSIVNKILSAAKI